LHLKELAASLNSTIKESQHWEPPPHDSLGRVQPLRTASTEAFGFTYVKQPRVGEHPMVQVTLESILGRRCLDWGSSASLRTSSGAGKAAKVWNCKSNDGPRKSTWYEVGATFLVRARGLRPFP
jgi:hypothetical protein